MHLKSKHDKGTLLHKLQIILINLTDEFEVDHKLESTGGRLILFFYFFFLFNHWPTKAEKLEKKKKTMCC